MTEKFTDDELRYLDNVIRNDIHKGNYIESEENMREMLRTKLTRIAHWLQDE